MIYQRSLAVALGSIALTLALGACGPAAGPGRARSDTGTAELGGVSGAGAARQVLTYEDEMVDLSNYPEPAVDKAGGIPPEDLTATPKLGGFLNIADTAPSEPHFSCCGGTTSHRIV